MNLLAPVRASLRAKLVLASTLISMVLLGVLLGNAVRNLDQIITQQAELRLSVLNTMLNQTLASDVFQRNYSALNANIKELIEKNGRSITYIEVLGEKGDVMASAGKVDSTRQPTANASTDTQGKVYDAQTPLNIDTLKVGSVRYGLSMEPILAARDQTIHQSLLIGVLSIILLFLAMIAMGSWLTRDLRKIVDQSRSISAGNYDHPVQITSTDEIGQLATGFNDMAEAIQAKVKVLQEQSALLDLAHDAILVRDLESKILFWNRGAESTYGWPRQETLGKVTHDLLRTKFPIPVEDITAQVVNEGQWEGELEHSRKDGSQIIVTSRWSLKRDEQGAPVAIMELNRDITERARVELERQRLASIIENSTDLVGYADLDGNLQHLNPAGCRLVGLTSASDPRADHISKFVASDDLVMLNQTVLPAVMAQGLWHGEFHLQSFSGERIPVEMTVMIIRDPLTGAPVGTANISRDIRERKQSEFELDRHREHLEDLVRVRTKDLEVARDEAVHANRAKSEFLSRMSHELRTPMNAILGFAQVLEVDGLAAQQLDYVQEIHRAGDHLLELINDLLDLSRIEAGRLALTMQTVNVHALVLEGLMLTQGLIESRQINVNNQCDERALVLADPVRLRQILVNLLSNAAKYNCQGGSIRVECVAREEATLRLSVSDTGPGISPEKKNKLFQMFERLGAENSTVDGTGIGLAFSKRLAELMGATLDVDSMPGRGSTFWIDLPLAPSAQESVAPQPGPEVVAPSDRRRILYIEDNAANLRVVEAMFRHHPGLQLLSATNGEMGLELARRYQPDMLLIDIHLPDMDGFTVLAALRADPLTSQIPAVALSADAMPIDIERGLRAGFHQYLIKPVKIDDLMNAMQSVLKTSQKTYS